MITKEELERIRNKAYAEWEMSKSNELEDEYARGAIGALNHILNKYYSE